MKPQVFLTKYGDIKKISAYTHINYDTVRKCLNGRIEGICSEATAEKIYAAAVEHGCRVARR